MPVSYLILDTSILAVLEGVVTEREMLAAQHAMFADPAFNGSYTRLVDATAVTKLELSDTIVRHLAQSAYERGLRKAALVSNDTDVVYGLMRMYAEYSGDAVVEVFRDRAAAARWLEDWKLE